MFFTSASPIRYDSGSRCSLANPFSQAQAVALGPRLDLNENLGQGPWLAHLDSVLGHFRKATDNGLQCTGVYIIAANMDKLVRPTQEASIKPEEGSPAETRLGTRPGKVTGAVAD